MSRPSSARHCFACHSQEDPTSDLALDSFEAVLQGGAGGKVVQPGDTDGSRLWKLITHQEQPQMPPEGDKLPDDQLQIVRRWIQGGLLKDAKSKPLASTRPTLGAPVTQQLSQPTGPSPMPEGLLQEPLLQATRPGPVKALAASPGAPLLAVGWQRQIVFYHTESHALLGVVPYLHGKIEPGPV